MGRRVTRQAIATLVLSTGPAGLSAQQPPPVVAFSPDYSKFLIQEPTISPADAGPTGVMVQVAGYRLSPRNNTQPELATFTALVAQPSGRGDPRRIVIPWSARVAYTMWSPGSDRVGYMVVEESGLSLWVADPRSGESWMLAGPVLNGAFGNPCQWLPSGSGLLCRRMVTGAVAGGDSLVGLHLTSQLSLIPLSGSARSIGAPGVYRSHDVSPDGRYVLVGRLEQQAGLASEVWALSGDLIRPVPMSGTSNLPRAVAWREDEPAMLSWVEGRPDGTGDRLMALGAPFDGTPAFLAQLEGSFVAVIWGRRDVAVVTERVGGAGRIRTWLVDPSQAGGSPRLFADRSPTDLRADPGAFMVGSGPRGRRVLVTSKDGRFAFLQGVTATPQGERTFLDRLELPSRRTFRLWRSEATGHEEVLAVTDPNSYRVITRRGSDREAPNYFMRDLQRTGPRQLTRLTKFGK